LFGVALLILDDGENVEQHTVSIHVFDDYHSQLRLPDVSLAPIEEGELAANPIFSVYAFCYGGGSKDWKTSVEKLLVSQAASKRPPLLSSIFAQLCEYYYFGRSVE
jgi:hypothetical protein